MKRIVGTAAIALALCFSQASYGEEGDQSEPVNPTQSFDFEHNNKTQTTTIDPGKTDVIVTCYGLHEAEYVEKTTYPFEYTCHSPDVSVTCSQPTGNDHCICHNKTKDSHTLKVTMNNGCDNPN